ncbi:hypothetical protein Bhyg_17944, partial [Pseudolycoriella hygida]
MAPVIELYYNSLQEIEKKADLGNKFNKLQPKILCKSALEVYNSAESSFRGGDEELAYILFMRYAQIIKIIRSSKLFSDSKAELEA